MLSMSLRARLLAGLATVAAVLAMVAYAVTTTTRSHLIDQVDRELAAAGDEGRDDRLGRRGDPGNPGDDNAPGPGENPSAGQAPERFGDLFEGRVEADGSLTTIFASNLPGKDVAPPAIDPEDLRLDRPFTTESVDGDVQYRALASATNTGTVVRALPLDDVDEAVSRLMLFQAAGVAAVLAVLGAVAWWVIHLGVRPLREMTAAAGAITDGDLSARVPASAAPGTESGDLARTLNTMLGRIEEASDERARSEQRLRRFVADASHELRTPVTTIQGYAELYRHGGLAHTDELDDAMRRTESEAQRMGRLVEEMLTLAKLDDERPIERQPVDLTKLVDDAVADLRVTAPDREVRARVEPVLVVEGDDDRLRQVLANIVGNAITHTPDGTAIDVEARADMGNAVVSISDHGPGMPPDVKARVTERFYRADKSRSRQRGGSGLGMAIASAMVDAHGGTIEIGSEIGRGTTVRVVLPRATPSFDGTSGDG